ncbi:MAG: response regulator [Ilumatobacteraceae bacterium]
MAGRDHPDVLVVDDNEDARDATIRMLERDGLTVAGASNATTAWDLVNGTRPRLVLLDVVLPDASGFDVLRRIRSRSDLDETMVVMLSSMRTSIPDRTLGLDAGADGYIVRPIDNDELVARVRAQLRQSSLLRQLRRSEQRYRDMIDAQVDGVLIVDRDGLVRYANPSADRLFALEPGELMDRPFGVPVHNGSPVVELHRTDGTSVAVEMSVVDTEWDDIPVWLVTLHDMSERHRLEEQLRLSQRLESIGRLTGGIAHDFNNLLAIILGASSELTSRVDGELADLSEMIAQAAERGADLTTRLLAFASRQFLEPGPLDVRDLVRSLLPVLRRSLGDTIDIDLVDDGTSDWALIDRAGLESAILNLCLNGRDAMQTGGRLVISLTHHVESHDAPTRPEMLDPGNYVALSVTDHGEGISPDNLQRVLEPFFTTKPPGVGTGLGLPMVYGFVRQSGGHMDIDSELGSGTTVTMFLPSGPAPDVESTPPSAATSSHDAAAGTAIAGEANTGEAITGRSTILVVDDDELLRNLVLLQIERLGHHAIGAADVDRAHRVLAEERVDLLLSDVRLGGDVGGDDLARQAQVERPELAVVLMSGLVDDVRRSDGATAPMLGKPFTHAQLRDAIDSALGR